MPSFILIGPLWGGNKKSLTVTAEELNQWIDNKWIVYHDKQKDVRPFIANADCVVMPSYREGMSNVLLEAASMARPLISNKCYRLPGYRGGWNKWLALQGKGWKGPGEKMKQMMDYPATEREEMGEKGREKMIREFDKKMVIQIYLQAIDEVDRWKIISMLLHFRSIGRISASCWAEIVAGW